MKWQPSLLTVVEVCDVVDDHVCVGLRDVILAVEIGLLGEEACDGDGLRDDGPLVLEDRHLAEWGVCGGWNKILCFFPTVWGGNLFRRFCNMFSESTPCLLG